MWYILIKKALTLTEWDVMFVSKMVSMKKSELDKHDVERLFKFMNYAAWICLVTGVVLCLWRLSHFSDDNLSLMVGIGFLIGSVFIYTTGASIYLVHKDELKDEQEPDKMDELL